MSGNYRQSSSNTEVPRTAVFIDGDWLIHATRDLSITIDYYEFAAVLREAFGTDAQLSFFASIDSSSKKHRRFTKALLEAGFSLQSPLPRVGGNAMSKGVDIMLSAKAVGLPPDVGRFVLVSGDGGFTPLLKHFDSIGVSTVLAVLPTATSQALSASATQLVSLEKLLSRTPPVTRYRRRQPSRAAERPMVPEQSPAPVRVEERNGRISRMSDRDSPLGAEERDFNDWREPVFDHIQEMLLGYFRPGTNHSRTRDRLVALAMLLSAGIPEMKERQFRIGYEIERFGGLVSAYRFGGDDMPTLSADVLEDLDRLHIALAMGIAKLERWAEFRRAAAMDSAHDGDANPVVVSEALNEMAVYMERRPTHFDPELPETFRFLAEATKDPRGATRTLVYGAVRSAENLISFLGRKALDIGANAVGAVEQHISKAVATALIAALTGAALTMSGAVPVGWAWLKPLLDTLARGGGG
jgi:uncharacterized LabA/DUF88 family protein